MILRATKATIHKRLFRFHARQSLDLCERWCERRAVIRIACGGINPDHPSGFGSRHHPDLTAEFIPLVGFAFGNALHLWRRHTVELAVIRSPLLVDAAGDLQQLALLRSQRSTKP